MAQAQWFTGVGGLGSSNPQLDAYLASNQHNGALRTMSRASAMSGNTAFEDALEDFVETTRYVCSCAVLAAAHQMQAVSCAGGAMVRHL